MKKAILLTAGPASAFASYLVLQNHSVNHQAALMAGVVVWVAFWWLTETVDLAITSLLPFILLPILGISKADAVAMQYMNQIIFLFIGGFFIAYAMEKWGLHERLAYKIILLTGNTPAKVLLGVMITSWFISMWVSNTATVMMLIAAVLAIVKQKDIYHENSRKGSATALLIGLSFSATIGGMATPVGTPPNMIFMGMYEKAFPENPPIDFLQWMTIGLPFSFLMLVASYFIIKMMFIPTQVNHKFDMEIILNRYKTLGRMKREEKIISIIFLLTVILWFFRENLNLGVVHLKGWSHIFGVYSSYIKDSTVVIFTSFFLFLIPSKQKTPLLDWKDAERIPLSVILLFGAGFALADGFESSGLSNLAATQLYGLQGLPEWFILLCIAITVTILSEFASNTASVQLVLPVVIPLAAALGMNPLLLMLTATFSASLGFMLPVATSANTIVYGTGEIKTRDMMRVGILLDVIGVLLITAIMYLAGLFL
ncbi:MAG: SLC13/DASS family transporter [Chitinophagales bacterium]|nr:SLC13/DASS family transporter [Chitinophagales bacterium]